MLEGILTCNNCGNNSFLFHQTLISRLTRLKPALYELLSHAVELLVC